jgi:MFS family permease
MAWLANPFAYLAINTVLAVMPSLANRLQLTVVQAGFICSVWLFTRTASFFWLWLWPGWHYRFRWLVTAFVVMTLSVVAMLMAPNIVTLVVAQIFFGLALGLIYYSSLYYSMDVGEAKGEHGGFHEAMIGAGNCVGPGIGAIALRVFPNEPSSCTWAVMVLMCCGLGGLLWLRFNQSDRQKREQAERLNSN